MAKFRDSENILSKGPTEFSVTNVNIFGIAFGVLHESCALHHIKTLILSEKDEDMSRCGDDQTGKRRC